MAQVGRCTGPVTWPGPMLVEDLRFTIKHSRTPVKVTLPGPMTVCDSILDEFYGNEESMAMAVADALNMEAKALASEGASVSSSTNRSSADTRIKSLPGVSRPWTDRHTG